MFGNSLFRSFENDPYFSGTQDMHMQAMNGMMFPRGMSQSLVPLVDGREHQREMQRRGDRSRVAAANAGIMMPMDPYGQGMFGGMMFGGGGGMFTGMNQMMANMHQMMGQPQGFVVPQQAESDPNSHFYSHSSVMTYSNTGNGAPKVYQATSSTSQAPGGLRQTRKTERDSERHVEKVEVGRHIGERGHVMGKQRDTETGDVEENQDYINIGEEEAPRFHNEFQQRSRQYSDARAIGGGPHRSNRGRRNETASAPVTHDHDQPPRFSVTGGRPAQQHGAR